MYCIYYLYICFYSGSTIYTINMIIILLLTCSNFNHSCFLLGDHQLLMLNKVTMKKKLLTKAAQVSLDIFTYLFLLLEINYLMISFCYSFAILSHNICVFLSYSLVSKFSKLSLKKVFSTQRNSCRYPYKVNLSLDHIS